ncbi:MAG: hypothetical protein ABIR79_22615, partial [Candidatus Binatia bacterium]
MSSSCAERLGRGWAAVCGLLLAVLIAGRWLRYTSWSAEPVVDDLLRKIMVVDAQSFLWLWVYAQLKLPMVAIAVGLVVLCLHRRLPAFLV